MSRLIYLCLHEVLHSNRLKAANVTWRYLEFAPQWVDDKHAFLKNIETGKHINQLDDQVEITLPMVGFEIAGVTMPNHRRYCTVWWSFNHLCALNGGHKLVEKVLDLYKDTLRSVIAKQLRMKITPRLIFKMSSDPDGQSLYYKNKMNNLVEQALMDEMKSEYDIEFKKGDNREERIFKNEEYHNRLLNELYADWDPKDNDKNDGSVVNGSDYKGNNRKAKMGNKKIQNKWIKLFLDKINKPSVAERKLLKRKRAVNWMEKQREKDALMNRIMCTDPVFVALNNNNVQINENHIVKVNDNNTVVIDKERKVTLSPETIDTNKYYAPQFLKHKRFKVRKSKQNPKKSVVVMHDHDLDLFGLVD